MRYYIRNGVEIRSENSAKPATQSSSFIERCIESQTPVRLAANYGSGKLRFLNSMTNVSQILTLVDSTIQSERTQSLHNLANVRYRSFLDGRNSIEVITTKDFIQRKSFFDRVYCLNVLAIVPIPAIRRAIIQRIYCSMKPDAEAVFVNRWRNSEFSQAKQRLDAREHHGGTLLRSFRGHAFYIQIGINEMERLALEANLRMSSVEQKDGTYYAVFKKSWI